MFVWGLVFNVFLVFINSSTESENEEIFKWMGSYKFQWAINQSSTLMMCLGVAFP